MGMDVQKIEEELNRRFAAPLKEFYRRRIIFWLDDEGEFESRVDDVRLENAKLVKISRSNLFAVKKLLAFDDTTSNYLAYCPIWFQNKEEDWLLNVKLYGEEFRADLVTIWLGEMGLKPEPAVSKQVRSFRKFFDSKERREKIAEFAARDSNFVYTKLRLAITAVLSDAKESKPNAVLRAVFKAGLNAETNDVYRKFVRFEADSIFKRLAYEASDYDEAEPNLLDLATRVLLSASTRTASPECFRGLERFLTETRRTRCYDFVWEWANDAADLRSFYEFAREVERATRLKERFDSFRVEDIRDASFFPCVNEVVLKKLTESVVDGSAAPEAIEATVEKRRAAIWYDYWANYYEGLSFVAKMLEFDRDHSDGFHETSARDLWKKYESDYWRMDSYYRGFHLRFQRCLKKTNVEFDDLFKRVADRVEALYSTFLEKLGENWANVASDGLKNDGYVSGSDSKSPLFYDNRQTRFYERFVKNASPCPVPVVVISDALRFDVAASLAERLRREKQSDVDLTSQCGIFPTITPYGMAALLPHSKLTVEKSPDGNGLTVLADGLSTDAANRDAILKKARPNSVALQYKNIVGMKRDEQRALVTGMDVVYIYHDKIDGTSHSSEDEVFSACEDAIEELCNLTRIITKVFRRKRVVITSDHGFLYSYRPTTEDAKLSKGAWKKEAVDCGKRYAILPKGSEPKSMLPICFLDGDTDYEAFSPRGNVRIKAQGAGTKFVHGGASLQEMVVPVIDYRSVSSKSQEYKKNPEKFDAKPATLALQSAERKICNMTFALNFYQKDPVGDNREKETYSLYFANSDDEKVSDVVKIIADKTNADARERTFRRTFNLKQIAFDNKDVYYLVIVDDRGLQIPQREEFQIDIPFAVDEFDFFN